MGFIGLKNDDISQRLLVWWENRLLEKCIVDTSQGYFVDQKWLDLVPGFFERVFILRDPGFNVAYWNLHERRLDYSQGGVLCNGEKLYFFHFSGYNPDVPHVVSKHQNRFSMNELGATRRIFKEYAELLRANGYDLVRTWPYAYALFDNGVKIPQQARRLYLNLGNKKKKFGDPFITTDAKSFLPWLIFGGERQIPPLFRDIYDSRQDLQLAFPSVEGEDRLPFLFWILADGKLQHELDEGLLKGLRLGEMDYEDALKRAEDTARRRTKVKKIYHRLKRYHFLNPILEKLKPIVKKRVEQVNSDYASALGAEVPLSSLTHYDIGLARRGINLAGYFQAETGMGMAVRSDANSLDLAGIPYVLNNFHDSGSMNNVKSAKPFSNENPYHINLIHVNADQIPIFAQEKGAAYLTDRYNIGRWEWELSEFPMEWQASFDYLDEIWAASNFALDSIARVSSKPVVRMPHSINVAPEDLKMPKNHAAFNLSPTTYVFLFVFDFHSFMARKNPLGLIEAFKKVFSIEDKAVLILKCSHAESCPEEFSQMEQLAREHNIRIINKVLDSEEIKTLFATADCYVSLHRSEGFGLTMAEAMALGKPVIATAYSGNMDFMTLSNSYLVKYSLKEIDQDYGPYKKGMVWAEPDIDDAARLMRYVYENQDEAHRVGAIAANDMKEHFSPDSVGKMYAARIDYILEHRVSDSLSGGKIVSSPLVLAECDQVTLNQGLEHLIAQADILVDGITVESKHRLTGLVKKYAKRAVRKSTYWLLNPLFRQVSQFNHEIIKELQVRNNTSKIQAEVALSSVNITKLKKELLAIQHKLTEDISNSSDASKREYESLSLKVEEVFRNLTQQSELVSNINDKLAQMVVSTERINTELHPLVYYNHDFFPVPSKTFDYFGFEQMFRGNKDLLQGRLKQYVNLFAKGQRVLDVGCGRGDFLELLKENGIVASGVDIDPEMVETCRNGGFDVACDDFENYLDSLSEHSTEGIFSAQFIEHLVPERIDSFIKKSYNKLTWGGKFVAETINPYNLPNSRFFYVDPTHQKPIFPEVARFICLSAGFRDVQIRYIACFGETRAELREPWDFCDYAVIARK